MPATNRRISLRGAKPPAFSAAAALPPVLYRASSILSFCTALWLLLWVLPSVYCLLHTICTEADILLSVLPARRGKNRTLQAGGHHHAVPAHEEGLPGDSQQ